MTTFPTIKSTYFDNVPLLECPTCNFRSDSIRIRPDDDKAVCPNCYTAHDQDAFALVEEMRLVFVCAHCGLSVPKTPGNIAWSGDRYICPRCREFLTFVQD